MACGHKCIALATDLYELTMGATYLAHEVLDVATFSLFVRALPGHRSYLVSAGLDEAIRRLTSFAFDPSDTEFLASTGRVTRETAARIARVRFTGDVVAVPEGRVVFGGEPLLEVQAPMLEAQLMEAALLNALHYPMLVATKASRCIAAAPGRALIDFGLRRAPDIDASVVAARACFLAGFAATSNVLAGRELGIPLSGTVAHSLVEAFPCEVDAFRAAASTSLGPVTLLVDTYDVAAGVAHAIQVGKELSARGAKLAAVRLDSGDLLALSRRARVMLDEAELRDVRIVASGGLDEYDLQDLARSGAPIDAYGLGTRVGMSVDAPVLDMAYKLVEYAHSPRLKLSPGKASLVGPKQVWRRRSLEGCFVEDRITSRDEKPPGAGWEPLLEPVMVAGRPRPSPSLREIRARHADEMGAMPPELLDVRQVRPYTVALSPALVKSQRIAQEAAWDREGLRRDRPDGQG